MKLNNLILSLIANYAAAISIPENARNVGLEARYIGELCTAPVDGVDFVGTCEYTSWCSGRHGTSVANYCPGPNDVQCCIEPACASGAIGFCEITSTGCAGGIFVDGYCPGPNNYKCCSLDY
ncbi:hypothetical protein NA56DRAFT_641838 [Hyaloscypha hepaticicola]|uniref:Uncharacterized protein n=1 Tax=Hyaloscypha hepaticicola TaxID=2082293 RepID=A0A2J6QJE0_9HELO|nr:hypothetical protein NA56DRAFT_641838 [Hyaloscypha hepaticicola]